jgi:hypothetical protein
VGIYLTTNPRDALNYAEEAGIGEYCRNEEDGVDEMPEPVVVTIPGSALVQLVLSNSLRIDPDWGWLDGLESDARNRGEEFREPDWIESLDGCQAIHVAGFAEPHEDGLVLTGYADFEALLDEPTVMAARPLP